MDGGLFFLPTVQATFHHLKANKISVQLNQKEITVHEYTYVILHLRPDVSTST